MGTGARSPMRAAYGDNREPPRMTRSAALSATRCSTAANTSASAAAGDGSVESSGGRLTARTSEHRPARPSSAMRRSEEHTSELQSRLHLVCRLLLLKKKKKKKNDDD